MVRKKETSYLKTEGYEIIYPGINGSPTTTQVSSIKNYLLTEKVDICYIGQDIYAGGTSASDKEFRSILAEYLNKKGVLILFWEANPYSNGGAQTFFQEFFANPNIKQERVNARGGGLYKLSGINDEITNGPFGDARGKYWGEDASWAMSIGNLPSGEIDVYSWGDDYTDNGDTATHSYVTGFKHRTLNLIFFGDGGFPSSTYTANGNSSNSATICPFYWEAGTMKPIPKPNYGYGSAGQNVYNSIVWCNVMAWAIKQAQFNGINTP
ncbi:hypothetical protein [Dysgonomonas sp. Marseille-P4677]|uniref:hypothetical protein n=1 Tax=Dysgonomonas sp. Marseille-P4677 TaxID=2364790 RepID=UPI001F2F8B77|nr:hypothetical protein [Dysgonomonas sp. Marseille-P4677]